MRKRSVARSSTIAGEAVIDSCPPPQTVIVRSCASATRLQGREALVSVASFHLSFTGHGNLGTAANRNVFLAQRRIIVWMASSEPASGEAVNGSRIILADDDFLVREGL